MPNKEEILDDILIKYSNTQPKKKIGKIPRIIAKIVALLPLEVVITAVKNKIK